MSAIKEQIQRARENKKNGGKPGQRRGDADWRRVSARDLRELVFIASEAGGAIRFGKTRDGGALAIGLYLRDESFTVYSNPHDDLEMVFQGIAEFFGGTLTRKAGDGPNE